MGDLLMEISYFNYLLDIGEIRDANTIKYYVPNILSRLVGIEQSVDGLGKNPEELSKRGITSTALDSIGNGVSLYEDSMKKWMRKYKMDMPEFLNK